MLIVEINEMLGGEVGKAEALPRNGLVGPVSPYVDVGLIVGGGVIGSRGKHNSKT